MDCFGDIVIFIPGIGGSNLTMGGRRVWGAEWTVVLRALKEGGLDVLSVTEETGKDDLEDGVEPDGVLDTFHVIPGLWKVEGYRGFCRQLGEVVGLTPGSNFFTFPYDWRRDNRVSARKLRRFIDEKLFAWRRSSGNAGARVVLVAHSMGGLVARHYVECLEGWRDVARLITLGTPYKGSLNALGYLVNGMAKGIGPLSLDATRPLRSFASVHQLLPTYRCVGVGDTAIRVDQIDLPSLDRQAVDDARAFHMEITEAVERNRTLEGYPAGYVVPIASARQPTFQSAVLDGTSVRLIGDLDGRDEGGDGTVPLASAVPGEMQRDQAFHVWGLHSALCNQEPVGEHVFAALRARRLDEDRYRSFSPKPEIRLSLDDVYEAGCPFEFSATVPEVHEQTLTAVAEGQDGEPGPMTTLHSDGDRLVGLMTLPEGAWRIRLSGRNAEAVSDLVLAI